MSEKISALVDKLGQLTIMEACELTKKLEEVWEIDMNNLASAPVTESAPVDEKAEKTLILTGHGEKKINVIKAIKAIKGLGLLESKQFVESVPKPVLEEASAEEVENAKKQLEEAGGTVEVK